MVVTATAVELVIAIAAVEIIGSVQRCILSVNCARVAAVELVVARAAIKSVALVAAEECVVTFVAVQDIIAALATQLIVALAAVCGVVAEASHDQVVPLSGFDKIVAAEGRYHVCRGGPIQNIADNGVVAAGDRWRGITDYDRIEHEDVRVAVGVVGVEVRRLALERQALSVRRQQRHLA